MAVGDEEDYPGMDKWPVVVEGEDGDYDYADEGDVGDVAIYIWCRHGRTYWWQGRMRWRQCRAYQQGRSQRRTRQETQRTSWQRDDQTCSSQLQIRDICLK